MNPQRLATVALLTLQIACAATLSAADPGPVLGPVFELTEGDLACQRDQQVVPLRSGRSARWIKEQLYGAIIPDDIVERLEYSGDAANEGKQICIDFIAQLAEVPGVAGAHVMAPNNEAAIPDVIAKARKLVKNRALAS